MNKDEVRDYIKDNLKLDWKYMDGKLYIVLLLEGKIIDKMRFAQE